MIKKTAAILALSIGFFSLSACEGNKQPKDNEVIFWHSMSGELGEELNAIISEFNQENPDVKITAINKGSYNESLNAGIAAIRSNNAPDILQVFEVGTATMIHSGNIIKPVSQLMQETGTPLDSSKFVGAVASYYSDNNGNLISMPFNSSTPILYYNKEAFDKAGLDPEQPPKTFEEVKKVAAQLVSNQKTGVNCGLTIAWPAWILFENGSARNHAPYATKNNGFGGLDARITLKHPYFIKILTDLSDMSRDRSFVYGGRGDKPDELFTTGQCAMLLDSSGSYSDIKANAKFIFGVGELPYYSSIPEAPQNSIIGGASLWIFNGKSEHKYKNIAKFLNYLSSPEVSARWHQKTGYVPVTKAAYELSKKQGYYQSNPNAEIPIKQLKLNANQDGVIRGLRLGNLPVIRDIEHSEIEKVFDNQETPEQALKMIEEKANQKLEEFEKSHH